MLKSRIAAKAKRSRARRANRNIARDLCRFKIIQDDLISALNAACEMVIV